MRVPKKPEKPKAPPVPTRAFERRKAAVVPPVQQQAEVQPDYQLTPEMMKKITEAFKHKHELRETLMTLYKVPVVVTIQVDKANDSVFYELRGVNTDKRWWYGIPVVVVPTTVVGLEGIHNQ